MINEPYSTALLFLTFGVLVAFSVLFSRAIDRIGVPVVLLFLVLGMLGGSEGIGGIRFDNYEMAFRLGSVALVLILFDGGLNTARSSIRRSIAPAGLLATVGVGLSAAIVALAARAFGLGWGESLLIGAIVSSTDAAAVFSVLRGGSVKVKEPVRSTLEVESCINDPMAVILTVTVVEILKSGGSPSLWLLASVPTQLVVGGLVGWLVGLAGRWTLGAISLGTVGLYPVLTLAIAFISFGLSTLVYGSGFLSVFATAAVLGNGSLPYKAGLTRVHDALAWLAQVGMFLMLGLLSFPSQLLSVAGIGLALGLVLSIVARPVAAAACVAPFGWPAKQVAYTAWVGIRGAVPIILATIPVMAQIPGSERVFNVVFFIVVVSALVPGASILPLTRRLGLAHDNAPPPKASIEMHSRKRMNGEIYIYRVDSAVAVCGAQLSEIAFPENVTVLLIIRDDDLIPARGASRLAQGDYVYILARSEDEPSVGLLFGRTIDQ